MSLRKWFAENKIFFEIGASVIFGVASLVISWSLYRVERRTLHATELSQLPHFSIERRMIRDEASSRYVDDIVFVRNSGSPVYNIDFDIRTFIVVERIRGDREFVYVPVRGYYALASESSAVSGEVAFAIGDKNRDRYSRFYLKMVDANKGKDPRDYVFIEIVDFSRLRYDDRFGEPCSVYFKGARKVNEDSVKEFFAVQEYDNAVDIDNLNVGDLLLKADALGSIVKKQRI